MHLVAILACYLVGSIPFGFIVAKARGVDIFTSGSGNIGATNVGRVLGRRLGILVFVLDFLKGAVPVGMLAYWRGGVDWIVVLAGLAAVLGHVFPLYLRFRGGKGVAVASGVVCVLMPEATIAAVIAFAATILACRMMSLASVVAAIALVGTRLSMTSDVADPSTILAIIVAVLVIVRHRTNIGRIRDGSERTLESVRRFEWMVPGLHAATIGFWCGGGWFFTLGIAGKIFASFEALISNKPDWLSITGNAHEYGSRLAGIAVAPMFPVYFAYQAICGLIATSIAIGWCAVFSGRLHRVRAVLLTVAMVFVAAGWPVAQKVGELRIQRYSTDNAISAAAKSVFTQWHLFSLFLNLGVLGLTLPALALAAYPPREFTTEHTEKP